MVARWWELSAGKRFVVDRKRMDRPSMRRWAKAGQSHKKAWMNVPATIAAVNQVSHFVWPAIVSAGPSLRPTKHEALGVLAPAERPRTARYA
jgi:hypothetical protein